MAVRSGKMPTTSVSALDFLVESFDCWTIFGARFVWECGEGQQFGAGGIQVLSHLGQFVGQRIEHSIVLGDNRFSVGLVEDRMQ